MNLNNRHNTNNEKVKCIKCERTKIYKGELCKSCFRKSTEFTECRKCGSTKKIDSTGLCKKCYDKKRYAEKKDEMCKNAKKYYEENKDMILSRHDKRYEENKDEISKKAKEYYKENEDAIKKCATDYRIANRELIRKNGRIRYWKNKGYEENELDSTGKPITKK